jgi:DNA polymerase-3 subunit gamma/tau
VKSTGEGGTEPAEWAQIVEKLVLKGLTHQLAVNCALQEITDTAVTLTVDPSHARLLNKARCNQMEKALRTYYGRDIKLKILEDGPLQNETPARRQAREQENRQQQAIKSIESDENIKAFQDTFAATVNYDSIRPRD